MFECPAEANFTVEFSCETHRFVCVLPAVLGGTARRWLPRAEVPIAPWKEQRWSSLMERHAGWAANCAAAEMAESAAPSNGDAWYVPSSDNS